MKSLNAVYLEWKIDGASKSIPFQLLVIIIVDISYLGTIYPSIMVKNFISDSDVLENVSLHLLHFMH